MVGGILTQDHHTQMWIFRKRVSRMSSYTVELEFSFTKVKCNSPQSKLEEDMACQVWSRRT